MILKDNKSEPFYYNNRFNLVTGEDDLEMQRASFQTYSKLLPGIRNLARRYRYYSLYCWLSKSFLNFYAKEESTHQDYKNFIRRGELLFGFISIYKSKHIDQIESDLANIFGSNYINKFLKQGDFEKSSVFDFSKGADIKKDSDLNDLYWQHSGGACYQYHLGPLKDMSLFGETDKGQPCFTNEFGSELADSFEESITKEISKKILEIINRGIINKSEVVLYSKNFSLLSFETGSREWGNLWNYLKSTDNLFKEGNRYRQTTLKLVLDYIYRKPWIDSKVGVDDFLFEILENQDFSQITEDWINRTKYGWAYYQLNQSLTYCTESVFSYLVSVIKGGENVDEYCYELARYYLNHFGIDEKELFENAISKIKIHSDEINLKNLYLKCKKIDDKSEKSVLALKYILLNVKKYKDFTSSIKKILIDEFNVSLDSSPEGTQLINYLYEKSNQKILEVIKNFIFDKLIVIHVKNVLRKIGSSNTITSKLLLEDNYLYSVNQTKPTTLAPRLGVIIDILNDLGIVDNEGRLTKSLEELGLNND